MASSDPGGEGSGQSASDGGGRALLLHALRSSGAEPARFGEVLRRWAREGRPYRGHVFSLQDVEAALSSLAEERRTSLAPAPAAAAATDIAATPRSSSATAVSATAASASSARSPAAPARAAQKSAYQAPQAPQVRAEQAPAASTQAPPTRAARTTGAPAALLGSVEPESNERRGRVATLRAAGWPSEDANAAAVEIVRALGPLPPDAGAARDTRFLAQLYDLAAAGRGDVQVLAVGGTSVTCHKLVLAASSPVLSCKFDGRFGDSGDQVRAEEYSLIVVRAAIQFAYIGVCQVAEADVGMMYCLADMWQLGQLTNAIERYVGTLPAVACVRALAEWDVTAASSQNLGNTIANRVADGFIHAGALLTPRLPTASLPAAHVTFSAEDIDKAREARERSEANRMPGWHFARQLGETVGALPAEALSNLRRTWIQGSGDDDGLLAKPLAEFLCAGLLAARQDDMKSLSPLRGLAGDALTVDIVERLCASRLGVGDSSSGEIQPWLDWACDGSRTFSQLWLLYGVIKARPRSEAATALSVLNGGDDHLDWFIERSFARAFVGSLDHDVAAPGKWEARHEDQNRGEGPWPALSESLQMLSRLARSSRGAFAKLCQRGALRVLTEAVRTLPTEAVRIHGPAELAGVYTARVGSVVTGTVSKAGWSRAVEFVAANGLVLQRHTRLKAQRYYERERDPLRMAWLGVPQDILENARAEWQIQRAEDDRELGEPLALAFDDALDPAAINVPWFLRAKTEKKGGRYDFDAGRRITLVPEAAQRSQITILAAGILTWSNRGGSLDALSKAAETQPVALQVCHLARAIEADGVTATQAAADGDLTSTPAVAAPTVLDEIDRLDRQLGEADMQTAQEANQTGGAQRRTFQQVASDIEAPFAKAPRTSSSASPAHATKSTRAFASCEQAVADAVATAVPEVAAKQLTLGCEADVASKARARASCGGAAARRALEAATVARQRALQERQKALEALRVSEEALLRATALEEDARKQLDALDAGEDLDGVARTGGS